MAGIKVVDGRAIRLWMTFAEGANDQSGNVISTWGNLTESERRGWRALASSVDDEMPAPSFEFYFQTGPKADCRARICARSYDDAIAVLGSAGRPSFVAEEKGGR